MFIYCSEVTAVKVHVKIGTVLRSGGVVVVVVVLNLLKPIPMGGSG